MYSRAFWDKIYKKHFSDAPWMSEEWAKGGIRLLEDYIPPKPNNRRLLDYGCGKALISDHFMQQGYHIELADISDELVKWLDSRHDDSVPIYLVDSPDMILGENKYDYIIAWGLFHHINPNLWMPFLDSFCRLMRKNALLLVSGWDDSDEVLKNEKKLGRFTQKPVWFINMLDDLLTWKKDIFEVVESKVVPFKIKPFPQERMIRFIVARKK